MESGPLGDLIDKVHSRGLKGLSSKEGLLMLASATKGQTMTQFLERHKRQWVVAFIRSPHLNPESAFSYSQGIPTPVALVLGSDTVVTIFEPLPLADIKELKITDDEYGLYQFNVQDLKDRSPYYCTVNSPKGAVYMTNASKPCSLTKGKLYAIALFPKDTEGGPKMERIEIPKALEEFANQTDSEYIKWEWKVV